MGLIPKKTKRRNLKPLDQGETQLDCENVSRLLRGEQILACPASSDAVVGIGPVGHGILISGAQFKTNPLCASGACTKANSRNAEGVKVLLPA